MDSSERLSVIRFPMILLILYIHSFVAPVYLAGQSITVEPTAGIRALVMFWSDGIARIAVPSFYLMSGYLYFNNFDGSWNQYLDKSKRRVFTLLIPYILWNGLVLALFMIGQSLPQTATLFNSANGQMTGQSTWRLIDIWLGITQYPIAYPFWFIRDLMLMVAVAPLLHWTLRRTHGVLEIVLLFAWLSTVIKIPIPSIEGLTFFVLGASFGMRNRPLFVGDGHLALLIPAFLVGELSNIWLRLELNIYWLQRPVILLGVFVLFAMTKCVVSHPRLRGVLLVLAPMSFFVFAAHEPLMTMLRKLIYRSIEVNQASILATYTLLPLLVAIITLVAYRSLVRVFPTAASILNGNRAG
ncbi:acyltransferase [Phenylobacterium sp.]|uniref:acyltransferase family protein n=1 Tax=Phenylobacterium sp. TaxID=1871053 RepID=UPI0027377CE6|nr:acyltransferase [Phenylobacterium sp.]MDP3868365.1 acyltransferase [Phenylobacterium sp.]